MQMITRGGNSRGLRTRATALAGLIALAATTLIGSTSANASASAGTASWVGSWSTAVTGAATAPQPETVFQDQTLRQIVHLSVGGNSVRVKLSNEYGDQPLVIGEARVARRPDGATGSQ
ncbi:MAG TPA: hypothetical protein VLL08_19660, partial [Kineosporiaceae bacterium]|nr:hypothetical protein [Kineosporiaceae bacterium]